MFSHDSAGRGVNGIAQFFGAGRSGFNVKIIGNTGFFNKIFHDKFRHGTAADIAVTDKKYTFHKIFRLPLQTVPPIRHNHLKFRD